MREFLRHIPSVLVMAAMVAIFAALHRRNRSARVTYWLTGWGLVFLPFVFLLLQLKLPGPAGDAHLEFCTLLLAGIVFLISLTPVIEQSDPRRLLVVLWGAPALMYSILILWQVSAAWAYAGCLAAAYFGVIATSFFWDRRLNLDVPAPVLAALVLIGSWTIYRVLSGGSAIAGLMSMMVVSYAGSSILFWCRYRRITPGVATTCAGFLSWATMWAVGWYSAPALEGIRSASSELYHVPGFFVAFGMIVKLLENESEAAKEAGERERAAKIQLERFADVTSRLLSGVDVHSFCGQIAQVITEATTFQRAIILLAGDDHLFLCGHSGASEEMLRRVEQAVAELTPEDAANLFHRGRPLGKTAALCTAGARDSGKGWDWTSGDELLVSLRSPRGAFVGFICLDCPRDPKRVTSEETSKIEMLATDLAVAIENATLQRQLLMSEKLAGMGQLVSGVAQEMNNPLTAILGYSELLSDRTGEPETRRGLNVMHREGLRMKRMVQSLLRFAQQTCPESRPVEILPLLQEMLVMKSYEARSRGVELVGNIGPQLPRVAVDENDFKQVFLHVLTNAFEAVEKSEEKRITIQAHSETEKVVFSVVDSGPGFSDLDRVFDPFFTTKSPGKGSGLGLSVCYGVLRQHGGSITARNLKPCGACVTVELPAFPEEEVAPDD